MPVNVVKPGQEEIWERAKAQAEKAGQGENWAYINSIFQNMKGKEAADLLVFRYLTVNRTDR